MDANKAARKELLLQEGDMFVPRRDVLQDATWTLTENDWARIEAELKRAIH